MSLFAAMHLMALTQQQVPVAEAAPLAWASHRVYEGTSGKLIDFEGMAAAVAKADIVFFGEQHDDTPTHRLEIALLEAVARRRSDVVLSLEMFERDVQPLLDRYLSGAISETEFLAGSRPWPNYAADYRPLVEFARAHGWRVVAANIPRPMASAIASKGIESLTGLTDSTRKWAAANFNCPKDRYFEHFVEAMGGHAAATGDAAARNDRYYFSQCLKDETMAESIVRARSAAAGKALVIHYNGAFHSDFGDGTAERVRRLLPGAAVKVISVTPSADLDGIPTAADREKGDWIVRVLQPKARVP